MPEPPRIPIELLHTCLRERYDIGAETVEYLPRGHDYRAGVYRVLSERGSVYLLKATSRPLYEPGCLVPRYLHDQGITAVVAPLPTTSGSLWTPLAEGHAETTEWQEWQEWSEWRVMVYPFLDGETSLTGMTDGQWQETGRIFRRIHEVPLPLEGFPSIRTESFDPSAYLRWVRDFEANHLQSPQADDDGSGPAQAVRAAWAANRAVIHAAVTALEQLGAALRSRALAAVIAHADLHAANLLRDAAGHVFVLDWDEVMLAPKERDFIFIREPHAQAFWQGYGTRAREAIDWVALTYFRWERVVQDLIEEAVQALLRGDVGEEAKALAARRFAATFAAGGNVDAAYAAAAHLPRDLGGLTSP